MEQLYTIGQVSKLKGVSPRMLRYYDQLGILVPKSVDAQTGYRRSRDFLWCKSRTSAIALPAAPASYFLRPKRSTTSPTTSAACSLSAARRSASGASGAGAGDSARAAEAGENSLWEAQRPSSPISTEQVRRIIDPSEGKDCTER